MSLNLNDTLPRLQDLFTQNFFSYLGVGLLTTLLLYRYLVPKDEIGAIRKLGGFPISTAWSFFNKRHDFIWENFSSNPSPHFKFSAFQHNIVVLRGEEARKAYFDNKDLNTTEGYKVLLGGVPSVEDINQKKKIDVVGKFNKYIALLLNRNRLTDVLPSLLSDMDKRMETWGKEGKMDPFKSIYDLVVQMTVRMATCAELAGDFKSIEEIQRLYWQVEKSATPTAQLLPWFPGPAKKRKERATKALFTKLHDYVELRKNAAVPSSDSIDVLLGQGVPTSEIVEFMLSVIFAGVTTTGMASCWALVYLYFHDDWKAKAKAEVDAFLNNHTANSSNEPLHHRLASIHVSVWEEEMPVLELIIRETIRLSINGPVLRRNLLEDLTISGGLINVGDFVTYPLADVHLNPEIYSRPYEFDPARYTPGREEDKKGTFSYLGWGAGRHPCIGMKVAKLEIKVILAFMLAGFEFGFGKRPLELPKPDRNDTFKLRPLGDPCYVQFKRTVK